MQARLSGFAWAFLPLLGDDMKTLLHWVTNACAYILMLGLGVMLLAMYFDVWAQ